MSETTRLLLKPGGLCLEGNCPCAELSGHYELGEAPLPPFHAGCDCFLTPTPNNPARTWTIESDRGSTYMGVPDEVFVKLLTTSTWEDKRKILREAGCMEFVRGG